MKLDPSLIDWNMNQGMMGYFNYLIVKMGYYSDIDDCVNWGKTARQLYRKTRCILAEKKASMEYVPKLDAMFDRLATIINQQYKIRGAETLMLYKRNQIDALKLLDELEMVLVDALHKAGIIMGKSDRKTGLTAFEEEWGLLPAEDDNDT